MLLLPPEDVRGSVGLRGLGAAVAVVVVVVESGEVGDVGVLIGLGRKKGVVKNHGEVTVKWRFCKKLKAIF